MTNITSLTKTGRASGLQWTLPWLEESTSRPQDQSQISSGVNNKVNNKVNSGTSSTGSSTDSSMDSSMDSSTDSSTDSSGVAGDKAVHPSGAPWPARGWTWVGTLLKGAWKWVWDWQRGGWKWRRGSDETGADGGIKTGIRTGGEMVTARTITEGTMTPETTAETTGRTGSCLRAIYPCRVSTSLKEVRLLNGIQYELLLTVIFKDSSVDLLYNYRP